MNKKVMDMPTKMQIRYVNSEETVTLPYEPSIWYGNAFGGNWIFTGDLCKYFTRGV